jgi:hypothetical protein
MRDAAFRKEPLKSAVFLCAQESAQIRKNLDAHRTRFRHPALELDTNRVANDRRPAFSQT